MQFEYLTIEKIFVCFLLLAFLAIAIYAIIKKKQYCKDPTAAEDREEWEEIGTSNNYDTKGVGGF
jgi:cell division protein FtsL